jgi:hypothetical protein
MGCYLETLATAGVAALHLAAHLALLALRAMATLVMRQ